MEDGCRKRRGPVGVAEVFEYGFTFAFFALVASLILVFPAKREVIVKVQVG